ncbi:MAG TPA: TraB/GumN family protein [Bacillota bacterium]|nr:TraB/GumN family protein [Bacillota bacterium]
MKRLLFYLILILSVSILFACESEEPVSIDDNHLEDAIRAEIDKKEGDLYKSDLKDIVKLDLSESGIEKLDGIDALENIETLSLENNDISDLTPLADLDELKELTVTGNPIPEDEDQFEVLDKLAEKGITVKKSVGEADGPGGFLWKVENNDTVVYLQGTIHIGKKDLFPLNEKIENAYSEADIVVPEVDINNMSLIETQEILQKLGMYEDGSDISDHISSDLYSKLEDTLSELGLPIQAVKDFKPWLITNTIQQLMTQKLGYTQGVDEYFLNRAEDDDKEVIGLETTEDQLSIFADVSPEMQEEQLEESLIDMDTFQEQMDKLLSLYMDGDTDELLDYLLMEDGLEENNENASEEEKAFMEALNDDRNQGMAEQIADFLEEDSDLTYFVIVGTLHLTMEPHIRSILEEKGYEVKSIY